ADSFVVAEHLRAGGFLGASNESGRAMADGIAASHDYQPYLSDHSGQLEAGGGGRCSVEPAAAARSDLAPAFVEVNSSGWIPARWFPSWALNRSPGCGSIAVGFGPSLFVFLLWE